MLNARVVSVCSVNEKEGKIFYGSVDPDLQCVKYRSLRSNKPIHLTSYGEESEVDRLFYTRDVVRSDITGLIGFIYRVGFRADCRVIGHDALLFNVDGRELFESSPFQHDLGLNVVRVNHRIGILDRYEAIFTLRFDDGALLKVKSVALKQSENLSRSEYEPGVDHYPGARVRVSIEDLYEKFPTPVRPFILPPGNINADFLPVFIHETDAHNAAWLLMCHPKKHITVTIDAIEVNAAQVFYPFIEGHERRSEWFFGRDVSELRPLNLNYDENMALRCVFSYYLKPDDVVYAVPKGMKYEEAFYRVKHKKGEGVPTIPLLPREAAPTPKVYKRTPIFIQRLMFRSLPPSLRPHRRGKSVAPTRGHWRTMYLRLFESYPLTSAPTPPPRRRHKRRRKKKKHNDQAAPTPQFRVGERVQVQVLSTEHFYDVVWQNSGDEQTGVSGRNLASFDHVCPSIIFMPGDWVVVKDGTYMRLPCAMVREKDVENTQNTVGVVTCVDQSNLLALVMFVDFIGKEPSRFVGYRVVSAYQLTRLMRFAGAPVDTFLDECAEGNNVLIPGHHFNETYRLVITDPLAQPPEFLPSCVVISKNASDYGYYEFSNMEDRAKMSIVRKVFSRKDLDHFRPRPPTQIASDDTEESYCIVIIEHLGFQARVQRLMPCLANLVRVLEFVLDVETSLGKVAMAIFAGFLFGAKRGPLLELPFCTDPQTLEGLHELCNRDPMLCEALDMALRSSSSGQSSMVLLDSELVLVRLQELVQTIAAMLSFLQDCCFQDFRVEKMLVLCSTMLMRLDRSQSAYNKCDLTACSCKNRAEHLVNARASLANHFSAMHEYFKDYSEMEILMYICRSPRSQLEVRCFCRYAIVEQCRHFYEALSKKLLRWYRDTRDFLEARVATLKDTAESGISAREQSKVMKMKLDAQKRDKATKEAPVKTPVLTKPVPGRRGNFRIQPSPPDELSIPDPSSFQPALMETVEFERQVLKSQLPEDMIAETYEKHPALFAIMMKGPTGTPYEGGYFFFAFCLPLNYPKTPPAFTIWPGSVAHLNPLPQDKFQLYQRAGDKTDSWPRGHSRLLETVLRLRSEIFLQNPLAEREDVKDNLCCSSRTYNEILVCAVLRYNKECLLYPSIRQFISFERDFRKKLIDYIEKLRYYTTLDKETLAGRDKSLPPPTAFDLAPVTDGFIRYVLEETNQLSDLCQQF